MKWCIAALALTACVHRAPLPAPTVPLVATSRLLFPARPRVTEEAAPVVMPAIESFRLANGLSVLLVARPELSAVTVRYVASQAGEAHPHPQQGWATLARRTLDRTLLELRADADFEVRNEGGTSQSSSWFELELQPEALPGALTAFAAALAPRDLSPGAIGSAVDEQLDEVHAGLYAQGELARLHAHQLLYGPEHPFGSSLNGSLETLKPLTVAELRDYQAAAFAPERSVLVIVGDVQRDTVEAQLARAFAGLPSSGRVLPGPPPSPATPKDAARALLTAGRTAFVNFSYRAPAHDSADQAAFTLLGMLAGDLLGSRLMRALREEGALTYHVHAEVTPVRGGGTLDIETQVAPETLLTALRVLDTQLARLRDELVSEDELAVAKLQARERFALSIEGASELAALLGEGYALGGDAFVAAPAAALERKLAAFEAVDATQLREVARRYLRPEQRAVAVAGPLADFEHALARWHGGSIEFCVPRRLVRYFD